MKIFGYIVGVFGLLALVGVGCVPATQDAGDTVESMAETVKIGVMLPLSGDAASYGTSVQKGVELAKKDGRWDNIELVFGDSKCEGKDAAAEVTKLINVDKVVAIIGELCSGATLAAAPVAEGAKVPMISPGSTSPALTDAGSYIFRVVPSDALQGAFGSQLVYDKGYAKLAVLYVNDDYGVGFDEVLKKEFPALGGAVVASEAVERKSVDLRTQLTKIKAAEPDALYIISNSPDTASAALKQITELGLETAVFASEGLKSDDVLQGAGGGAEGMTVTAVSGGTEAFVAAHNTEYGEAPGPFAAQGYDALMAIGKTLEMGATTGEMIKDKLLELSFEGVSGQVDFDENGDVSGNYTVFVVKDGVFVRE